MISFGRVVKIGNLEPQLPEAMFSGVQKMVNDAIRHAEYVPSEDTVYSDI